VERTNSGCRRKNHHCDFLSALRRTLQELPPDSIRSKIKLQGIIYKELRLFTWATRRAISGSRFVLVSINFETPLTTNVFYYPFDIVLNKKVGVQSVDNFIMVQGGFPDRLYYSIIIRIIALLDILKTTSNCTYCSKPLLNSWTTIPIAMNGLITAKVVSQLRRLTRLAEHLSWLSKPKWPKCDR
jgi:hypothetical protein